MPSHNQYGPLCAGCITQINSVWGHKPFIWPHIPFYTTLVIYIKEAWLSSYFSFSWSHLSFFNVIDDDYEYQTFWAGPLSLKFQCLSQRFDLKDSQNLRLGLSNLCELFPTAVAFLFIYIFFLEILATKKVMVTMQEFWHLQRWQK